MHIYKVEKNASPEMRTNITSLMMEQMDALSSGMTEEDILKTIDLALTEHSGAEIFIAEKNDEVIGCAFLNTGIGLDKGGPYIWLNDLYVKKDYRRQGIARKLLLKVLYWAEQKNFKGIELETGINNAATKKLYNSLGFYDIVSKRYGRQL
ncbi:GNAT family N-acetyltransferase [Bacillus shivajii]|uniref:GNAT family N-acetyltransferase n=1 Tax=Bacillus shivajii TaxID=1983719 RepID=UPI001CFA98F9|nr:GNAT family N-acetyltransferase [Bacillus shivajii]UCZ52001.1 GNAT family N-acetyltransferase [Bacillus shivajii]